MQLETDTQTHILGVTLIRGPPIAAWHCLVELSQITQTLVALVVISPNLGASEGAPQKPPPGLGKVSRFLLAQEHTF